MTDGVAVFDEIFHHAVTTICDTIQYSHIYMYTYINT